MQQRNQQRHKQAAGDGLGDREFPQHSHTAIQRFAQEKHQDSQGYGEERLNLYLSLKKIHTGWLLMGGWPWAGQAPCRTQMQRS